MCPDHRMDAGQPRWGEGGLGVEHRGSLTCLGKALSSGLSCRGRRRRTCWRDAGLLACFAAYARAFPACSALASSIRLQVRGSSEAIRDGQRWTAAGSSTLYSQGLQYHLIREYTSSFHRFLIWFTEYSLVKEYWSL